MKCDLYTAANFVCLAQKKIRLKQITEMWSIDFLVLYTHQSAGEGVEKQQTSD